MAERSAFSMSRATDFLVKRRMDSASEAFLPRMRSSTSPAFWADVRMYFDVAFTSSMASSLGLRRRGDLGHLLHLRGVPLEGAGGRELAELVADHVLGDVHGYELLPVIDGQRVPDHLGRDGGAPRPRLHHLAIVGRVHGLDLLGEVIVDERTLLQ